MALLIFESAVRRTGEANCGRCGVFESVGAGNEPAGAVFVDLAFSPEIGMTS